MAGIPSHRAVRGSARASRLARAGYDRNSDTREGAGFAFSIAYNRLTMLKTVSLAAALLLAGQSRLAAQPSIDWLEPFVGVWATVDTYYPVSGAPTVERATRTCQRIMHDAYLQCETIAQRPNGTSRTYRFLLNYNRTVARFEMLSLWSNVPHKLVQSVVPNESRRRWTFANVSVIGDDEPMPDHWSELVFESPTRIVWTGRRVGPGVPLAAAPISFQETWTRVN